ncbi:subtilisin, partial [Methanosarcinales archaeon]
KAKGWFTYATAVVTVVDADGKAVEGAVVEGHWSGLTSDTDSGATGADGKVALDSDSVKNAAGTFTFSVDNVVLSGWVYDSASNVETSDSITV